MKDSDDLAKWQKWLADADISDAGKAKLIKRANHLLALLERVSYLPSTGHKTWREINWIKRTTDRLSKSQDKSEIDQQYSYRNLEGQIANMETRLIEYTKNVILKHKSYFRSR